ncbi:MAG: transporter substrate-binding domain-containing protein [Pseudomonadota bacterium]
MTDGSETAGPSAAAPAPPAGARAALTRHGPLRVGINTGNGLLVTGRTAEGAPAGVAPDLGAWIAGCLGVGIAYVPYGRPADLAAAAEDDAWDIAAIGAEPERARTIAFTAAYAEIRASFLARRSEPPSTADWDRPGQRIAVYRGSAYGLWLARNTRAATLVERESHAAALEAFRAGEASLLAGLAQRLDADAASLPGTRVLDGAFMAVQQAVGTPRRNAAAAPWLAAAVEHARSSGLVAALIARHGVEGLDVAPAPQAC